MAKDLEVAILFADVVGSTQLYDKFGDTKASETVAHCLEVMKDATHQFDGTVIKTIGDEVMSTFQTADDAMSAATQMQARITTDQEQAREPTREENTMNLIQAHGHFAARSDSEQSMIPEDMEIDVTVESEGRSAPRIKHVEHGNSHRRHRHDVGDGDVEVVRRQRDDQSQRDNDQHRLRAKYRRKISPGQISVRPQRSKDGDHQQPNHDEPVSLGGIEEVDALPRRQGGINFLDYAERYGLIVVWLM